MVRDHMLMFWHRKIQTLNQTIQMRLKHVTLKRNAVKHFKFELSVISIAKLSIHESVHVCFMRFAEICLPLGFHFLFTQTQSNMLVSKYMGRGVVVDLMKKQCSKRVISDSLSPHCIIAFYTSQFIAIAYRMLPFFHGNGFYPHFVSNMR